MKIYGWIVAALFGGAVLLGCGGNGTSQTAGEGTKSGDASVTGVQANSTGESPAEVTAIAEPPLGPTATPAEIVSFFLDSLQAEDTPHVAGVLTEKARIELHKAGYTINAVGRPDMKFEIGEVRYVGSRKDAAHVETNWTSTSESPDAENISLTWVLRKQAKGWRVAGVAVDSDDGKSQVFKNFERPQEMYEKQDDALETATKGTEPRRQGTRQK